jgi:hypothetical protein
MTWVGWFYATLITIDVSEANLKKASENKAKGKRLRVVKSPQTPDAGAAKSKFVGTADIELQAQLMVEFLGIMGVTTEDIVSGSEKATNCVKRFGAVISGIDPQDEIQGMLAIQLIGAHHMSTEFARRAMHPQQHTEGVDANVSRAAQFMKIFIEQAACLQRLKGKRSEQRIVIERVDVHQGGQAIVGTVTPRGEGEG